MEDCLRASFVQLCWHVLESCLDCSSSISFSMKTSSSSFSSSALFVILKLCIVIFSSSSCL